MYIIFMGWLVYSSFYELSIVFVISIIYDGLSLDNIFVITKHFIIYQQTQLSHILASHTANINSRTYD